jgi:hypothetical protein
LGLLFLLVAVAILTFSSLGTATRIIQQRASKRDIGQVVFVLSVLKV